MFVLRLAGRKKRFFADGALMEADPKEIKSKVKGKGLPYIRYIKLVLKQATSGRKGEPCQEGVGQLKFMTMMMVNTRMLQSKASSVFPAR